MLYKTFKPSPRLAPYVRFYWVLEADVCPGEQFVHRSAADSCVEMVFHYNSSFDEVTSSGSIESSPLASIQAQSTRFRRFSTGKSFGIFGAYLYPFAVPKLFSFPAYDLTNISPDLESVFGASGKRLEEQMITAADTEHRLAVINSFFEVKLDASACDLPLVCLAVKSVIEVGGNMSVSKAALDLNLSTRQFERKFKEFAGLPPKLYSRIARFQAATQHRLNGNRDLTDIAYACGYYDQSHFINDFREFSGYTPKEYFWNQAEGTQYMDTERMSHFSNS